MPCCHLSAYRSPNQQDPSRQRCEPQDGWLPYKSFRMTSMIGSKASTGRLSVVRPATHGDESQNDVVASLDLPANYTPLPSYARPTTCSRRRASAVALGSRRAAGAAGIRPQSAKDILIDAAHETSARDSAHNINHPSKTSRLQSRISSRKSNIAPGAIRPMNSAPGSWSASPRRRARDSSAASDQQLQSSRPEIQGPSSSGIAKRSSSRNTRSSPPLQTSTGVSHGVHPI